LLHRYRLSAYAGKALEEVFLSLSHICKNAK
jgi:hypothetical protein